MKRLLLLGLSAAAVCLALILRIPTAQAGNSPLNLSNTPDDSRNPAIAVGSNGSRHVVWEETIAFSPTLSLTELWHRAWTGSAWTAPVTVSTGIQPALAVGPDQTAHLVWTDDFSGTSQVFYSRWTGSSWSVSKLIAPGLSGNATAPAVAVDMSNTVYAAWGQFSNGTYKLYYAYSAAGGTGAWNALPVPDASGDAPALAVGSGGTLHVVWQQAITTTFGAPHDIYYSALTGGSWSLVDNITHSPGIDSATPALSLTADGRPLAVWSASAGGPAVIDSAVRGSNWSIPINVSSVGIDATRPRITRAQSDSIVMWNQGTVPGSIDWAFGGNGTWTAARPLVADSSNWGDVALAGGSDGTVHYVYDGGPTANGDIFYNAFALLHVNLPLIRR